MKNGKWLYTNRQVKKEKVSFTFAQREALTGWLFIAPVLTGFFLVFTAFSKLYFLVLYSYTDWNCLSAPKWVGFANYH